MSTWPLPKPIYITLSAPFTDFQEGVKEKRKPYVGDASEMLRQRYHILFTTTAKEYKSILLRNEQIESACKRWKKWCVYTCWPSSCRWQQIKLCRWRLVHHQPLSAGVSIVVRPSTASEIVGEDRKWCCAQMTSTEFATLCPVRNRSWSYNASAYLTIGNQVHLTLNYTYSVENTYIMLSTLLLLLLLFLLFSFIILTQNYYYY